MGYTHYFPDLMTTPELSNFAAVAVSLSSASIRGADGSSDPITEPDMIALNGDESKNEDCESFILTDSPRGDFCKTEGKPYDVVVSAILLAALKLEAPGYNTMSTDGSLYDFWDNGSIALYAQTYNVLFVDDPLDSEFRKRFAHFTNRNENGDAE